MHIYIYTHLYIYIYIYIYIHICICAATQTSSWRFSGMFPCMSSGMCKHMITVQRYLSKDCHFLNMLLPNNVQCISVVFSN